MKVDRFVNYVLTLIAIVTIAVGIFLIRQSQNILLITDKKSESIAFHRGADYAEFLPRQDEDEYLESADVVGVVAGAISRDTEGAQQAMILSSDPAVVGNVPDANEMRQFHPVAMMGQVSVKVRGFVNAGDLLVPSGLNDGTARAISPQEFGLFKNSLVLGVAWQSSKDPGVKLLNAMVNVGIESPLLLHIFQTVREQAEEIRELNMRLNAVERFNNTIAQNVSPDSSVDRFSNE